MNQAVNPEAGASAPAPQVVILCGGQGTRLREETEFRPKPLVEVGGRPILWHIMKTYAHYGFSDFILCLGYKGGMIREYFLNYRFISRDFTLSLDGADPQFHGSENDDCRWRITFSDTGADAMTGARVKRVEQYIRGDHFLLTYGDGVGNVDVAKLWAFHLASGKLGTVTGVRTASRYGEMAVECDLVTRFSEKPQAKEALVSGGYFVFRRQFLDYLSADSSCVLEREPLERLAADRQLACYGHDGFWQAMDTYRDFEVLNHLWQKGPPWRVWE